MKLDINVIVTVRKSPIRPVARDAVMHFRKCHAWYKLLFIKNVLFLETNLPVQDQRPELEEETTFMSFIVSQGTEHETIVCLLTTTGNLS